MNKRLKNKILVIDDDTRLRNLLGKYLSDNNFEVELAKDAAQARQIMDNFIFDIIIVDVMMQGESGVEFTKAIREESGNKHAKTPILMLTAMGDLDNRIIGLEAGADDYLSKPFEPKELLLRINNILKRIVVDDKKSSSIVNFGEFTFNSQDLRLKKGDEYIHVTESESKILSILCRNVGKPVLRDQLSKDCGNVDSRSIDVLITRIRRKIEINPKQPQFLQTVRNHGYVLYQ